MKALDKERYAPLVGAIAPLGGELHYQLDQDGKVFQFILKHVGPYPDESDSFWGRVIHDGHVIDEYETYSIAECLDWLCNSV